MSNIKDIEYSDEESEEIGLLALEMINTLAILDPGVSLSVATTIIVNTVKGIGSDSDQRANFNLLSELFAEFSMDNTLENVDIHSNIVKH